MAERGRPRSFDKEAALNQAMLVFWEKGYDGASMADLTSAMGIASPSIYAAFGSKEDLFRLALGHYTQTKGRELWSAVESAQTAYGAVEAFLMHTARIFTQRTHPSGCLVVLSALHPTDSSALVRDELIQLRSDTVKALAQRIRSAVATGEIAASADVESIAKYYATVQQGMSIQARDGATRKTLEAIAHASLASWAPLTAA